MKKWIFVMMAAFLVQSAIAQTEAPPFKRNPTLPPLQLMLLDSTTLTNGQLKKQPTIIMFFSPTCDHCKHQMEDMIADMKNLDHTQIIMATYQPFDEISNFYKQFGLSRFPNIKLGRDVNYKLPPFYNIRSLPYLALYNKKGDLITTYEGNVTVEKLVKALR